MLSFGEHALAILRLDRQAHRVGRNISAFVPFDVDAPLRVVHQVDNVGAVRRVHRHALAARDVADDLLAADWIAALGPEDHHIVGAAHLDAIGLRPGRSTRLTADTTGCSGCSFSLVLRDDLVEHQARRELAVADLRQQILGLGRGELGEHPGDVALEGSLVPLRPKRRALVVAAGFDGALLLFDLDQVLDLVAGAGRDREVQPVAARLVRALRMISTMSPFLRRVRGTMPAVDATHWWPTSV